MAKSKRKLQEATTPVDATSTRAVAITTRLAAMRLMIELALNNANRANLEKVRLNRMDREDVECLIVLLDRELKRYGI